MSGNYPENKAGQRSESTLGCNLVASSSEGSTPSPVQQVVPTLSPGLLAQLAHLQYWSRLQVRYFEYHGSHHFVFGVSDAEKTICTYRAAKNYAISTAYGRLA